MKHDKTREEDRGAETDSAASEVGHDGRERKHDLYLLPYSFEIRVADVVRRERGMIGI